MSKPEANTLKAGDKVRCGRFSGDAVILEGPNSKGEYKVALGNLTLLIPGAELKPFTPKKGADPDRGRKVRQALTASDPSGEPLRVDLHGLQAVPALEALERALDQAILKGNSRIEVIHGIGSGTLKKAVHEYLSRSSHVERYNVDDSNPGTTWVYL